MIINLSRGSQFQECRQKAKYWHIDGLMSWREDGALIKGGAYHQATAKLFATGDVAAAVAEVDSAYAERPSAPSLLPEEQQIVEQDKAWVKNAVRKFAEFYKHGEFKVLWPEVEFTVPLPNTLHHCWFFHQILYPDIPYAHCAGGACQQPIFFQGKTDGVIEMGGKVWLLEQKTTAITGDTFFDRFFLDFQPTGYIYGIWKKTKLRPHGFLLNVVKKPNKRASDQLAVGFEREPYFRSQLDLERFERELILLAEDYEDAIRRNRIYMNTKSCLNYNRRCYYWDVCKRGGEIIEGEFRPRIADYVDKKYYELLGLPVPGEAENAENQIGTANQRGVEEAG